MVQDVTRMEESACNRVRGYHAFSRFNTRRCFLMLDNGYLAFKIISRFLAGGENMAIKDYWIYQERQSETTQWAIYCVKEFSRGKPEAVVLDFTIYSDDIPTATNSKSFVGWHYPTVRGYVDALICELMEFCSVNAQDKEQLDIAITRILQD